MTDNRRFPAEWEPHEAVWISWPESEVEHLAIEGYSIEKTYHEILSELLSHVNVCIVVTTEEIGQRLTQRYERTTVYRVKIFVIPKCSIWIRDFGPIFTVDDSQRAQITLFGWNHYGRVHLAPPEELAFFMADQHVSRYAATQLNLPTYPATMSNGRLLVSEGGDREFNGKGTLMVTEQVELQRNPGQSKEEIEEVLKRSLNVKKVVWLKNGMADDRSPDGGLLPGGYWPTYGTNGHIDEFARFVNESTILLNHITEEEAASCPIARSSKEAMDENENILSRETDQDGRPFKVLHMPVPPPLPFDIQPHHTIFRDISNLLTTTAGVSVDKEKSAKVILPASYCNFLVTNGLVLCAKYSRADQEEKLREECLKTDREAARVLGEVFPGRKIVQLDVSIINLGGGGIHCITQQQPALRL
ncbi:hypothetical protein PROFUN_13491 [Planoprotostelium fungivorum]|uniref:Agmatine deiminase n=1 Tax=Planoprotostelium fungivorum TaxID=1890364 RepID=A0A2P6N3Y3_9EUKA|nr:hypothetical protein PROFUN_13491 [Planoprotostelium fungivorum]